MQIDKRGLGRRLACVAPLGGFIEVQQARATGSDGASNKRGCTAGVCVGLR